MCMCGVMSSRAARLHYWQQPEAEQCCATQSGIRYPVVVRFKTVNYAGVSTNNYAIDEVEQL